MNDRDCKTCARSSLNDYGGNDCTSWDCDYINRREAIDAWLEKYRPDQPAGGQGRMAGEVQTGSTGGRPGNRLRVGDRIVWQMTLDELTGEAFKPNGKYNWRNGIMDWFCPLCGEVVGIHSDGRVHEKGWMYKRDECRNGHRIDWEEIE